MRGHITTQWSPSPTFNQILSTILSILTSLVWEKIPHPLLLFHTATSGKLGGACERGYGFLSSLCRKCVFSSLISFLSPFPTSFSSSWFIPFLPFHYPSPLPPPPPPPPSFSPFNSPFHFCSFSPTPFFNFLLSVQKNPDCLWDTFQCRKAGNVWSLWYGWGKRRWRTWSW